jgi:hypothetical protein
MEEEELQGLRAYGMLAAAGLTNCNLIQRSGRIKIGTKSSYISPFSLFAQTQFLYATLGQGREQTLQDGRRRGICFFQASGSSPNLWLGHICTSRPDELDSTSAQRLSQQPHRPYL